MPLSRITDGTTNTFLYAEVKAWQPYTRNGGPPATEVPQTVSELSAAVASGAEYKDTGHTEWPDGRVHHTGFTAVMTPNTIVPYQVNFTTVDADYNSWQEGKNRAAGQPTYASVTSRSHHPGQVQAARVDGSVQTVSDGIDLQVWRAFSTRSGDETVGDAF